MACSLGRMFQERADNGKKREVRRSCDTQTVAPLPRRDSGGARLLASPSHGSTSHGSLPAMIASSSIPWSAIEIADLQCAMDEHGRIGALDLIDLPRCATAQSSQHTVSKSTLLNGPPDTPLPCRTMALHQGRRSLPVSCVEDSCRPATARKATFEGYGCGH